MGESSEVKAGMAVASSEPFRGSGQERVLKAFVLKTQERAMDLGESAGQISHLAEEVDTE